MKVITWNVRGLRDGVRRASLARYLREWEADCALLQETHIEEDCNHLWHSLKQGGQADIRGIDAQGRSGGIAVWWRCSKLSLIEVWREQYIITCKFRLLTTDQELIGSCVYGPCADNARNALWQDLSRAADVVQGRPWLVGGDFNCTFNEEDRGSGRLYGGSLGLKMAISALGLSIYPSSGAEYTWRNGNGQKSKLDRFFGNAELLEGFQLSSVKGLDRPFSDHTPLLWESEEDSAIGSYFPLKKSWLREEGCQEMIGNWWSSKQVNGSATFRLATKLKELQ
jgi:exonuclease III